MILPYLQIAISEGIPDFQTSGVWGSQFFFQWPSGVWYRSNQSVTVRGGVSKWLWTTRVHHPCQRLIMVRILEYWPSWHGEIFGHQHHQLTVDLVLKAQWTWVFWSNMRLNQSFTWISPTKLVMAFSGRSNDGTHFFQKSFPHHLGLIWRIMSLWIDWRYMVFIWYLLYIGVLLYIYTYI